MAVAIERARDHGTKMSEIYTGSAQKLSLLISRMYRSTRQTNSSPGVAVAKKKILSFFYPGGINLHS